MDSSGSDSEGGGGRRGLGAVLGGGGRRKRRQTDESLFGVFADGPDDDSDEGPRKGKGRGRGKGSMVPSQPLTFVRGEKLNQTHVPAKGSTQGAGESDDEIDPRFKLTATTPTEPVVEGPKLQARNKMSMTQMAANYGKGFAMLQKMGFAGGGLGAKNDGIANPIEVQVRRKNQGLQEEGEMVDQDLFGTEHVKNRRSVEELLTSKSYKNSEPRASESWKKDAPAKRPRTIYKTAAEVAGEKGSVRIIDMRGPDVKIASSFTELAASISGDSVKSLKELRHNTRVLVAKYEDRIRNITEKKKHYEDILISVAKESEQMKQARSLTPADLRKCRALVRKVEDVRRLQDNGLINLEELAQTFANFQLEQPKEFQALRVLDVAVAFAVPAAKRELASWSPLLKPEDGLRALSSWKSLLETEGARGSSVLCDEVLLPKLRSALIEWSVRDFEPCIRLFECCCNSLPSEAIDTLGMQILLPRIQVEVDRWDPRTDKMPIHVWIHPWLPILGSKLNCLWTSIRFKLSSCLEHWDPRDRSAREVLRPWQKVFDPANWDPLIEKVLNKLERAVADTPVKPNGQDLSAVENLLAWLDVLPAALVARVLDIALFPQWHAALRQWVRGPECDFNEMLQWYQGWRTLLPAVVREHGSVQRHLAHGLEVMKSVMSGCIDADDSVPAQPQAPGSPPQASTQGKSTAAVFPEDVTLNLSDYIADVAAEHGLVFRPKAGAAHLGKQIYKFGAASICFDKNLVYAARKGGGDEWIAVSFDEVLKLALRPEK